MPYNKLLRNIISNTNYTHEEISKKCSELGIDISRSYITKLENSNNKIPTEKVSRAIAKVCNVDERLLVIEGYLDKAPKEIRDAFLSLKNYSFLYGTTIFENIVDNNSFELIKNMLEEEPLSDFILSIKENCDSIVDFKETGIELKSKDDNIIFNLGKTTGFKITDNAMYPVIKENDEVIIEIKEKRQYKDSDILLVKFKEEENATVRQAILLGNIIRLVPLNNKFTSIQKNINDINIIGKVIKIIREI